MNRVQTMIAAAVADERERCAAHVEAKAAATSALIGKRSGVSAEMATHVGRVVAALASELRGGFHQEVDRG